VDLEQENSSKVDIPGTMWLEFQTNTQNESAILMYPYVVFTNLSKHHTGLASPSGCAYGMMLSCVSSLICATLPTDPFPRSTVSGEFSSHADELDECLSSCIFDQRSQNRLFTRNELLRPFPT
jgi:hypothetical protein